MADHNLTNEEISRYSRQLILPEFGVERQQLLKWSSALVVGCGGLGCPSAIFLAAAGIGTLGLLDHDTVDVSNLHRQILHQQSRAGDAKCESARAACEALNSLPKYIIHNVAIDSSNAIDIISPYDVVLDCTDNVATRYLLNDACVIAKKPLISGAALKFEGQLTIYNYKDGPCYRCLYPTPPPAHTVTSCSEGGVMGVTPGIIGTMQAQEAIKVLTNMEGSLCGRLFLYDGLAFTTRVIKLRPRQATCVVCGDNPTITKLIDYNEFCGAPAHDKVQTTNIIGGSSRISAPQYKSEYVDSGVSHLLIDTRPPHETHICKLPQSTNISLKDLLKLTTRDELVEKLQSYCQGDSQPDKTIPSLVFVCQRGNDSQLAVNHVNKTVQECDVGKVLDIHGGLEAWAKTVDQSFPRY